MASNPLRPEEEEKKKKLLLLCPAAACEDTPPCRPTQGLHSSSGSVHCFSSFSAVLKSTGGGGGPSAPRASYQHHAADRELVLMDLVERLRVLSRCESG